jgi:hypothetical protein
MVMHSHTPHGLAWIGCAKAVQLAEMLSGRATVGMKTRAHGYE